MQYLNEAIGLLMPGVRFRCMVAMGEKGEPVPEWVVLDELHDDALAAVLAAEDGGKHNLAEEGRRLHWLRLADPKAERPGDEEIAKQQDGIAGMVDQAAGLRQKIYNVLAKPVIDLIGRSLVELTVAEAKALERFERCTGQTVRMDAHLRLIEPLPVVEAVALVYPVTLHQDGLWIYGEDNQVAWQAYVNG